MSTKLMTAFTRHTGLPYLQGNFGQLVRHVLLQPVGSFEVDPKLLPPGAPVPQENMDRLQVRT